MASILAGKLNLQSKSWKSEKVKTDALPDIRQRILDAALDIVQEQGIKALTQPRVSKAAGLRQSHLTYYFPRKADLLVALLQASHDRTSKRRRQMASETFDEMLRSLKELMLDCRKMRFFLGIVLEASEKADLQPALATHARALAERVAKQFERKGDDPSIIAFIDALRGIGLRQIIDPDKSVTARVDLETLAASYGLYRPQSAPPRRGG